MTERHAMRRMRKAIALLVALFAIAGLGVASGVAQAAPSARAQVVARPAAPTSASAATQVWNLEFGNYGGLTGHTVWSNRSPAWSVGNISVRLTFKIDCNLVESVYGGGTSFASNTSHAVRPCKLIFAGNGDIYIQQYGSAIVWRTYTGLDTDFMDADLVLWSNQCLILYQYNFTDNVWNIAWSPQHCS
jgi:hypothetical protein